MTIYIYDVGFAQLSDAGDGILAQLAWIDLLMVAISARSPLMAYKRIPLDEVLRYLIVTCDPQVYEGYCYQVERVLRAGITEPLTHVSSARVTDRMASLSGDARMRRTLAFAHIERNACQICLSSARATAASPTLSARPTTA